MNKALLFLLDIFFPNRCPVCGEFIGYDENICKSCTEKLRECAADGRVCRKCGKPDCICTQDISYSRAAAAYYYEGCARDGILALKSGGIGFGRHLGQVLAEKILEDELLKSADFIVPVPMDRHKRRERGYNQAEVIAKEISALTKIPLLKNALSKDRSETQHMLGAAERKRNVSAFRRGGTDLSDKRIIVCDDVITTGSTVRRCAELLKEMNAAEVFAAVGTTTKLKKE